MVCSESLQLIGRASVHFEMCNHERSGSEACTLDTSLMILVSFKLAEMLLTTTLDKQHVAAHSLLQRWDALCAQRLQLHPLQELCVDAGVSRQSNPPCPGNLQNACNIMANNVSVEDPLRLRRA